MSNVLKTFAVREQLRIGQRIANQLPKLRGATEVARELGISATYLRRLECIALAKVSYRLHQIKLSLETDPIIPTLPQPCRISNGAPATSLVSLRRRMSAPLPGLVPTTSSRAVKTTTG